MNFYDNYIALCNKAGKSPSAVALEIGLTKPTITRWKKGSTPTDATIRRVADYFDVPVPELKGSLNLEDMLFMTAKDNNLLEAAELLKKEKPADQKADGLRGLGYDERTPENQKMIDDLIEKLLKSQSGGQ